MPLPPENSFALNVLWQPHPMNLATEFLSRAALAPGSRCNCAITNTGIQSR